MDELAAPAKAGLHLCKRGRVGPARLCRYASGDVTEFANRRD